MEHSPLVTDPTPNRVIWLSSLAEGVRRQRRMAAAYAAAVVPLTKVIAAFRDQIAGTAG